MKRVETAARREDTSGCSASGVHARSAASRLCKPQVQRRRQRDANAADARATRLPLARLGIASVVARSCAREAGHGACDGCCAVLREGG
jgi:hypothetical protein